MASRGKPYQRRCVRDDSRKFPACARRKSRAILAQCCAQSLPVRNRRCARCALCGSESAWRRAYVVIFCSLRGLTPATHLILWRYRWLRPRRPVVLPGARGRSRLSLPKNPVRQRDMCECLLPTIAHGDGWSVERSFRGPQSLRASVVALVWREAPLCISLLTLAFQAVSARDTYEGALPSRMSAYKTARNGPAVSGEVGGNHARRGARG